MIPMKIKNFEGKYFTCCMCEREIMHGWTLGNSTGSTIVYGSECVLKATGVTRSTLKKAKTEASAWEQHLEFGGAAANAKAYNLTLEEYRIFFSERYHETRKNRKRRGRSY